MGVCSENKPEQPNRREGGAPPGLSGVSREEHVLPVPPSPLPAPHPPEQQLKGEELTGGLLRFHIKGKKHQSSSRPEDEVKGQRETLLLSKVEFQPDGAAEPHVDR